MLWTTQKKGRILSRVSIETKGHIKGFRKGKIKVDELVPLSVRPHRFPSKLLISPEVEDQNKNHNQEAFSDAAFLALLTLGLALS